ncbi:hypothetical protein [Thiovibrio frasassiensis]|uniref:Uncharacterized protein n=1 Tax=Thiovibrio frasassiensis TaxID=2984131 RepID=A0A9X4MHN2_9BACT|nr:hypothetical protein [Thiovibrio frasassiensis]MDG4476516.1 hypothetical protein [Thiovibrio frasassiensis]
MDWLHKTIDEYEKDEKDKEKRAAVEKAKLEKELNETRRNATQKLSEIYKVFVSIKKELQKRKYPCEAVLGGARDAHSDEQINTSVSLVVDRQTRFQGNKLSPEIDPSITFKHDGRSKYLTIKSRLSGSSEFDESKVELSMVTNEYLSEITEKFIKSFFSINQ